MNFWSFENGVSEYEVIVHWKECRGEEDGLVVGGQGGVGSGGNGEEDGGGDGLF